MSPSRARRGGVLVTLALLAGAGGVLRRASGSPLPAAREVAVATADKLTLSATFHAVDAKGGPGVVLLPMFRTDRSAWDALIDPLTARGVAVLAIDPRGHGRSAKQGTKDLAPLVEKRDAKLFAAMHQDAIAAVRWLAKEGGCDPKRIVLVGASVGGSVAMDAAARYPEEVAAVAWLSPGPKYLGLDSVAHAKAAPATLPVLLLAHAEEAEGVGAIRAARPTARVVLYPEAAPPEAGAERGWAHGTNMLSRLPLVDRAVASFVALAAGTTEDVLLDGLVAKEGVDADPWDRAVDVGVPGAEGTFRAFRVGRRVLFGGSVGPDVVALTFEVQTGDQVAGPAEFATVGPPQVVAVDLETSRVLWSFGGMASVPNFPGLDAETLFGKTYPVLRAVRSDSGTTFEGEWTIPRFGGASRLVRLAIVPETSAPGAPRGGMVTAHPSTDLPSR